MQKDHLRTDQYVTPENIQRLLEGLNESEFHIIDCIFEDWNDFHRVIMNIEDALSKELIKETDIQNLYQVIHKIIAKRGKQKEVDKPPSLARTFFELPEIIHKHLKKQKLF
jgi:hypothetical protein